MSSQGTLKGVLRGSASRSALRRTAIVAVLATVASGGLFAAGLTTADAYEANTAAWTTGTTSSVTLPSGLVVSETTTGLTTDGGSANTLATRSATTTEFTPNLATTTPTKTINTDTAGCTFLTQTCANKGTITITFSQPVTNPVLHFAGFGGRYQSGSAGATSLFSAVPVLTGSSPAGATLGAASSGSTNLVVTGGNTINRTNAKASTACSGANTQDATALAGCGSVPVVGTVTSLTFRLDMNIVLITGSPGGTVIDAGHPDAWDFTVTADEDFGDAPASYNAGVATSNTVGDLKLGATIDADNTTVANATASPFAVAAGANANGTNGDGADEDAFTTLPDPVGGQTFTRTVPISGASKAGIVCGWIDFDRGGTFNTTNEQACQTFAAGATSAVLTWTVPSGASPGLSYARLRTAYGSTTLTPTGREDSGEIEDYSLTIDGAPLNCSTLYGSYSAGPIDSINPVTGAVTQVASIPGGNLNSIGITANGRYIYGTENASLNAGQVATIARYDTSTGTATTFTGATGVSSTAAILRGGINPANGIYYYVSSVTGGNQDVYAFDTNTNTSIGYVGTLTGFTGGSGDLTFDANGNMIILISGNVAGQENLVLVPNVPTTAGSATLVGSTLAALPVSGSGSRGGIAWGSDGYLYVSTATVIQKIDPNSGAIVSTVNQATSGIGDMASCTVPSEISLRKNIASRANPTDQFTLSITGNGIASGNTATTTGNSPGLQTGTIAGPVIGVPGQTYTVTEAAASGSLTSYTSALACVDAANGNAAVATTQVTSAKYTFVMPATSGANVVCTFTNTGQPRITLTKALGGTRVNAGDQFQVQIRTVSAAGTVVSSLTNATTTGSGATVTAGSGTTGAFQGTPGTDYYLTESGQSGAVLTDYANEAITCTDANGVQTGLPSNAPFSGSQKITPVAGANISCTLTNTPNAPALTLAKSALPTTVSAAGQSVAYSFLVTNTGTPTDTNHNGRIDAGDHVAWTFTLTNTGLVTLHTITIADPKAGPVTCVATTLAPGASTTCAADNPYSITTTEAAAGVVHNTATATGSCGCNATVKAVHAAAVVPTSKAAKTTTASVVPGLPFTGAMGVVWAVRGGIAALMVGAFLLLVARRRREDDDPRQAL